MDDRMQQENQKEVAAAIMGQSGPRITEGADDSVEHFDRVFAKGLFKENSCGLDLSDLDTAPQSQSGIREDLVQQAAQSLVRDQNDAFLAITNKMTPDEITMTLATARQWRRTDPDWQDTLRSAPEVGFKFIDRAGAAKNKVKTAKPNKAEALARDVISVMRENKLDPADTPKIVRSIVNQRGLTMSERQLVQFSARIAKSV